MDRDPSVDSPSSSNLTGSILLADDEPQLVGMYSSMLEHRYEITTATNGEEALRYLTDSIDVVLLDRRMPGMSGDEVAREIRTRGYDTRIAMVTAVEPEIDVLEVPFDAYVVKPVRKRDLETVVDHLYQRNRYSAEMQELLTVSARLAAIESRKSADELRHIDEYLHMRDRRDALIESTRERLDDVLEWDDHTLIYRDFFGTVTG